MSGNYDERLLIAYAYDAENQLLSLAFAIVEKEDDFGWSTADDECVHRLCMQQVVDNLDKNTRYDKWVADTFKIGCRRKKPRRVEEMFRDFAKYCSKSNAYLLKVGKNNLRDLQKPPHMRNISSRDGGYCWGIMTTNGSESLNIVFKQSRMLPVAAIIDDTFYKLNA